MHINITFKKREAARSCVTDLRKIDIGNVDFREESKHPDREVQIHILESHKKVMFVDPKIGIHIPTGPDGEGYEIPFSAIVDVEVTGW